MATPYERSPFFIPATGAKPLSEQDIADYDSFMVGEGIEEDIFSARYLLDRLTAETL